MYNEEEIRIAKCPKCRKFVKIYLDYKTSCPHCASVLVIDKPVERVLNESLREYIANNVHIALEEGPGHIRKGFHFATMGGLF